MPYSDHIHEWERRRELADPRPCTLPTKAPAGMLGAWVKRRCPDCRAVPCEACRLDRKLAQIHRGLP